MSKSAATESEDEVGDSWRGGGGGGLCGGAPSASGLKSILFGMSIFVWHNAEKRMLPVYFRVLICLACYFLEMFLSNEIDVTSEATSLRPHFPLAAAAAATTNVSSLVVVANSLRWPRRCRRDCPRRDASHALRFPRRRRRAPLSRNCRLALRLTRRNDLVARDRSDIAWDDHRMGRRPHCRGRHRCRDGGSVGRRRRGVDHPRQQPRNRCRRRLCVEGEGLSKNIIRKVHQVNSFI